MKLDNAEINNIINQSLDILENTVDFKNIDLSQWNKEQESLSDYIKKIILNNEIEDVNNQECERLNKVANNIKKPNKYPISMDKYTDKLLNSENITPEPYRINDKECNKPVVYAVSGFKFDEVGKPQAFKRDASLEPMLNSVYSFYDANLGLYRQENILILSTRMIANEYSQRKDGERIRSEKLLNEVTKTMLNLSEIKITIAKNIKTNKIEEVNNKEINMSDYKILYSGNLLPITYDNINTYTIGGQDVRGVWIIHDLGYYYKFTRTNIKQINSINKISIRNYSGKVNQSNTLNNNIKYYINKHINMRINNPKIQKNVRFDTLCEALDYKLNSAKKRENLKDKIANELNLLKANGIITSWKWLGKGIRGNAHYGFEFELPTEKDNKSHITKDVKSQ